MTDGKRTDGSDDKPEGWESLAEESEGTLAPNPELEEALKEAADAVEARETRAAGGQVLSSAQAAAQQELAQELLETKDKLLRLQADFENFRRRALKERQESLQYGHQNLVKDLLSTVDNLDRAIDHVRQSEGGEFEALLKGVELVRKELHGVLANHEVHEISAEGTVFDPALHEAMAQAPDPSVPPNTVIDVLQKGYLLRDRLVRPARVVVPVAGDSEATSGDEEASE